MALAPPHQGIFRDSQLDVSAVRFVGSFAYVNARSGSPPQHAAEAGSQSRICWTESSPFPLGFRPDNVLRCYASS